MIEVHCDVVTSNVRSHGNDWGLIHLTNQMTRGHTIKVWHDDIHKNKIISGALIDLVHSFQSVKLLLISIRTRTICQVCTYRIVNMAMKRIQELATYPSTGLVVLYEKNLWWADPTRINMGTSFPVFGKRSPRILLTFLRWHWIWNIVNVFTVHWVYTIVLAYWVHKVVEVTQLCISH